ncbi:MAG: GNAT family N-acetyltransferase [Fimbriimonadales bacterium]
MRLEDATDVFCRSFAFTRNFTHPFEFVRVGGLRIMRDATPRREPRTQEIVVCGLDPGDAMRQIEAYDPPRHAVCLAMGIAAAGQAMLEQKDAYKAGGYRFLGSEDFFVRDLSLPIEPPPQETKRVLTVVEAERVAKAAGARQILPDQLGGNQVRLYASWNGDSPVGWVRSIHVGSESAWASNLHVKPEFRRRGIGKALMAKMLEDDAAAGAKYNVLLASRAGSILYPQVGYEKIGVLLIFAKKR